MFLLEGKLKAVRTEHTGSNLELLLEITESEPYPSSALRHLSHDHREQPNQDIKVIYMYTSQKVECQCI